MTTTTTTTQLNGLAGMFPITALFGNAADNSLQAVNIVGIRQDDENPLHTTIDFTGSNYDFWAPMGHKAYGWGNSVESVDFDVEFKNIFNLLADAHRSGAAADLTQDNLTRNGLWAEAPEKPATPESPGLFKRMFG